MWGKRLPASKRSPLFQRRPGEAIPGKGAQCLLGQFGMRALPYVPPTWKASFEVNRVPFRSVYKYCHIAIKMWFHLA